MWLKHPIPGRVLQALAALRSDADFQEVLQWLEQSKTDTALSNARQETSRLRDWGDGAVQALDDFLKIYQEAPRALQSRIQQESSRALPGRAVAGRVP